MRILFDTNTLISAAISNGKCFEVLEHCLENHLVYTSDFIIGELERKLSGKFHFSKSEISEFREPLLELAIIVAPESIPAVIAADPDDDNILAAALAAQADCLISGDKHIWNLKKYKGIPILRAGQFLAFEAEFE